MRNGGFSCRHIQPSIIASSMEWTLGKNLIFLPSKGGEMPLWYVLPLLLLLSSSLISPLLSPWIYFFLFGFFPFFSCLIVTLPLTSSLICILSFSATGCSSFIMRWNVFKVGGWQRGEDGEMDGCMAAWSGITWGYECVCVCLCIFTRNWHSWLRAFSPCDGVSIFVCECVFLPVSVCLHVCTPPIFLLFIHIILTHTQSLIQVLIMGQSTLKNKHLAIQKNKGQGW